MKAKKIFIFIVAILLILSIKTAFASIVNTPHDLRYDSTADIRANVSTENQLCKFCHIPHGAQVSTPTYYSDYQDMYGEGNYNFRIPLISHRLTETDNLNRVYTAYNTTWTLLFDPYGDPTQDINWTPSGVAKVCFSCHDATIPVGQLTTENIDMMDYSVGGNKLDAEDRLTTASWGYLGSEINPVREVGYFPGWHELWAPGPHIWSTRVTQQVIDNSNQSLKSVGAMQAGLWGYPGIDRTDFVQCTGCHDPHSENIATNSDGSPFGYSFKFWNVGGSDSYKKVCAVCHSGFGY